MAEIDNVPLLEGRLDSRLRGNDGGWVLVVKTLAAVFVVLSAALPTAALVGIEILCNEFLPRFRSSRSGRFSRWIPALDRFCPDGCSDAEMTDAGNAGHRR